MATVKHSTQRDALLNELVSRFDHPTAENLFWSVKKVIPNISLATVYRNLNFLENAGNLIRFSVDGVDRFDGNLEAHCHFVCSKCKQVSDIFMPEINKLVSVAEEKSGSKITSHRISFFGTCKACNEKII